MPPVQWVSVYPTTQTTSVFESYYPDSEHWPILTTETTCRFFLHIEFWKRYAFSSVSVGLPNYTNYIWFRITYEGSGQPNMTNYRNYTPFRITISSFERASLANYTNYIWIRITQSGFGTLTNSNYRNYKQIFFTYPVLKRSKGVSGSQLHKLHLISNQTIRIWNTDQY